MCDYWEINACLMVFIIKKIKKSPTILKLKKRVLNLVRGRIIFQRILIDIDRVVGQSGTPTAPLPSSHSSSTIKLEPYLIHHTIVVQ